MKTFDMDMTFQATQSFTKQSFNRMSKQTTISGLRSEIDAFARHMFVLQSRSPIIATWSYNDIQSMDVKNHFSNKVFKTVIPRNVRVSEAPSFGQPVLMYDISCPGSQAYASLAGEIINQEKD